MYISTCLAVAEQADASTGVAISASIDEMSFYVDFYDQLGVKYYTRRVVKTYEHFEVNSSIFWPVVTGENQTATMD